LQQTFGRPRAGVEWARRVARAHEAFEVGDPGPYVEMFSRDASLRGGAIEVRGTDDIRRVCEQDLADGIRLRLLHVVTTAGSPWWRRSSSTRRTTRTIARQAAQTFSSMTVATWRAALTPISNREPMTRREGDCHVHALLCLHVRPDQPRLRRRGPAR